MNWGCSPQRGNIQTYNLCFLGFGNVNRTLAQLLRDRENELRDRHGITFRITGIATRRLGWIANPNGLDSAHVEGTRVVAGDSPANAGSLPHADSSDQPARTVQAWLAAAQADIL